MAKNAIDAAKLCEMKPTRCMDVRSVHNAMQMNEICVAQLRMVLACRIMVAVGTIACQITIDLLVTDSSSLRSRLRTP